MATVAIGLPVFDGSTDLDVFIDLWRGYLNSININPYDKVAGPPCGWERAMGILRSCMSGEAAEWFDQEITGKNWELSFINSAGAAATLNALSALTIPEGGVGLHAGTYVLGSEAAIFAARPANAALTVRQAFIPSHNLMGGDECWKRCGARPTSRVARGTNANNNRPIVVEGIRPNQALYWLRTNYTTVLEEKRRVRFNSLYQDNDPVDKFYKKVKRSGELLHLPEELISDQFFRGLSPDNQLEVERLGDIPIDNIVKTLGKLERRKAEMRLGLIDKKTKQIIQSHDVTPVHISQQEPIVLKSEQQFSLNEVNKLIQSTVERITQQFQTQIETLQNKLPQVTTTVPSLEEDNKPPLSRRDLMNRHIEEVRRNKDAYEDHRAKLISRFLEKEEQDSLDKELAKMLNNLSIRDPDDMDTSNMIRGEEIVIDNDGFLRKKK